MNQKIDEDAYISFFELESFYSFKNKGGKVRYTINCNLQKITSGTEKSFCAIFWHAIHQVSKICRTENFANLYHILCMNKIKMTIVKSYCRQMKEMKRWSMQWRAGDFHKAYCQLVRVKSNEKLQDLNIRMWVKRKVRFSLLQKDSNINSSVQLRPPALNKEIRLIQSFTWPTLHRNPKNHMA